MADYYSLLARKVASLEQSTPQARKAVYDLARRALLNQLRAIKPPIADEVIAGEERALDAAVARLEAECAVKDLPDSPTEKSKQPDSTPEKPKDEAPAQQPQPATKPASEAQDQKPAPLTPVRPRPAAPVTKANPAARQKRWFVLMAAGSLLIVGLLAFIALHFRERPEDLAKFNPNENGAAADEHGKIGDRVSDADRRRAAADSGPPVAVAQHAAFYVAYPNQPDKVEHIYSGTVLWRLENSGGADGGQLRPAIRGEVDFPDAKVKATILIQKNTDQALSASHTINIAFKFQGGDVKGVSQIGNVEFRRSDAKRGQPVEGIPVPINESNFLIGLMRGPSEARNLLLLRLPAIIDIPLKLSDNRDASINLEKGSSGDRVFSDALDAWSR
ncbi:hypothetical protein [Methylocystis bryophila]|uniref:Uncharacterized protein n=1 Tax=Methylocystis bryophila TaxID=655015 RepID=A0A1W6MYF8_9HYPH|nr:hypothetical protein [Methylocystis bryophila]ARN82615.1 hypothetical protein B1812_17675 [Methylocystis bryophila]BDV38828.1 hypothetical protein DSM21852_20810 [Methylocystis bryophila]